jgi:hypothetical protein
MAKKPGLASLQTAFGVVIAGITLMAATPPRGIPEPDRQMKKRAR